MKEEIRTLVYDDELCMEAYCFNGVIRPFPSHFHEYYAFGLVGEGERLLVCNNREYQIKKGDILLFNPGDTHGCMQSGGGTFAYRCLNIPQKTMLELSEEIAGERRLPMFSQNVICRSEMISHFYSLHEKIMNGVSDFEKEERLLSFFSVLIRNYAQITEAALPERREQVETACVFIRQHFNERISLEQLCQHAGLSKSTLLRAFIKEKGISPYRYLETVRVNKAKILLEKGVPPADVACQTGFFDQSHFINCFNRFIGITPGVYHEVFRGLKKGNKHGQQK